MSRRNKRKQTTLDRAQQPYPQGGTVIPNALIQQFMAQIQQQSKQQQGQNAFSPGKPLDPQNVNPGGLPIAFRYPVAYNVAGLDRSLGNPDIAPFAQLRNLADLYEGIQLCEKVWLDLIPRLQLKITLRPELVSDANTDDKYQKQIAAYQTFFEKPDGVNDLHSWLRIAITEQLQLDALYIYKQKTRGKQLQALSIIAGDTMKVLLDDWGRVMGYQQFPWGIPGEIFTPDQMTYFRESPRANTPYGKSRVERILMRVNQALRKEKKDLAYFTEGNIPHAIMEVPETSQWTPDQIEAFEAMWNSLIAGNVQQQVRVKFTQPGMKYSPLEQYQLLSDFDQFILNIATAAYGISLADLSFTGDIHKSSDDGQQNMLGRRTIYPLVGMYGMLLTSVIRDDFKDPRFVATFTGFEEQEDLQAMVGAYSQAAQAGLIGITDATNALKFAQPKDAPYIGRVMVTKDGPIFLDDMASDEMRNAAKQAKMAGFQQTINPPEQQQPGEQGSNEKAPQKTSTQSGKASNAASKAGNGSTHKRALTVDEQTAPELDNNGYEREVYDDLRKWRSRALDDVKAGRPFRTFVSHCIPQVHYTVIRDELQRCSNVEDVRALFERAKGGAYGPGDWQNTDKQIQQQLATLQAQGVTQVRWQTTVGACDTCTMNDQEVRPLGQPFLSGHILPPGHPNCVCSVEPVADLQQRYNEVHDAHGRFGFSNDSQGGDGGGGAAQAQLRALEQYMAAKYPQTRFDFTGCDPVAAGRMAQQLDILMSRYPQVARTIPFVGTAIGAHAGEYSAYAYSPEEQDGAFASVTNNSDSPQASSILTINPAMYGNPHVAASTYQQLASEGWFANGSTTTSWEHYTTTHEFGHATMEYLEKDAGAHTADAIGDFLSDNAASGDQVSEYAGYYGGYTGQCEQFAEAFASLHFAPPAQQAPYTQQLGQFLQQHL